MKIMENKKILLLASAIAVALPVSAAFAVTTTIDSSAVFSSALALNGEVAMDFGTWYYGGIPAAGDTITLGTNDSVTPTANFQANGGVPRAGEVNVAGVGTFPVEVTCDSTAIMTETAAPASLINVVEIEVTDTPGAFGTGSACGGAVEVFNLVAGSVLLYFGGKIDGATAANFINGTYSTSNGGGDDVSVAVVYQ